MKKEIFEELFSGKCKNYADLGRKFNLSRERIRQLAKENGIDIKKLRKKSPDKYSKKKIFNHICSNCNKNFTALRPNAYFCSQKCFGKFIKKIILSNQKTSVAPKLRIKCVYNKKNHKNKTFLIYRDLMEKHLGRKLKRDEIVHHIDGNIANNKIGNLKIMTLSEHSKLHRKITYDKYKKIMEKEGEKNVKR